MIFSNCNAEKKPEPKNDFSVEKNIKTNLHLQATENWSSPTHRSGKSLNNLNEFVGGNFESNQVNLSTFKTEEDLKVPTICMDIPRFQSTLLENKGLVIFKFGATWCKPCKTVEPYFNNFYKYVKQENNQVSDKIECINIDVDDSFELYATMKRMRMVKGLPTFLAFYKGNNSYIADDSSIGSDIPSLQGFFNRSLNK
jgi:thiol-disulfide isomerase/thioredoxin